MSRGSLFVKLPRDRIGALIGPEGKVKEHVERKLSVKLEIDSESGDVAISLLPEAEDPSLLFRAKEVATAIGRGFSPERAFRLIHDQDAVLEVIDLREIVGRSLSDLQRLKGRVIGQEGKTRRIIEELTDAYVSVHGHTIALIADLEEMEVAREAIKLFLRGSQHSTVYRFLHKKRRELKKRKLELWKTSEEELGR